MSPRVSCLIARRYHIHRNDESSFGPEYESGSYVSDGFLNPVSLVFDEMRQAQSICVFVLSLFDNFHIAYYQHRNLSAASYYWCVKRG